MAVTVSVGMQFVTRLRRGTQARPL